MMKLTNAQLLILLCLNLVTSIIFAQVENVSNTTFPIEMEGHLLKIPFYANQDLFANNSTIDKAVIVIHGTNRNADEYFENMEVAARSVPDLTSNTLIVAPQFLTESDVDFHDLDAEHLYWTNGGWKSGSNSRNEDGNPRPIRIPSYAVLDSLLIHLTTQFPNLSSIVFTGHSAGGQVTQRMAATSPLTDILCMNFGVNMRFVVANPSSYVYMDGQRKTANSTTEFALPTNSCTAYNEWKYGLDDLFAYPKLVGIPTIRSVNKKNTVTYLLGENDNNPNSSSLDNDCEAKLQGAHRLERGMVYFNYLQHYYGTAITANHDLVTVPNVGHNNFDMYNSREGIGVLFERATTNCGSTVSTKEMIEHEQLIIYPNPSQEILNIKTPFILNKQAQLLVFDFQGRLLSSQKATRQLDVSNLDRGMYLLVLRIDENSISERFLIH